MIMTALEDDETQKAGIVMVGYNIGPRRVMDRKAAFAIQSIRRYLPFYLASVHYCYDDFRSRPMMTVAMLVMGGTTRVRFRAHYGESIVLPSRATKLVPCAVFCTDTAVDLASCFF